MPDDLTDGMDAAKVDASVTDAAAVLTSVADLAKRLIFEEPRFTRGVLSRSELAARLPGQAPPDGFGVEKFLDFLRADYCPNLRNYRHPLHFGHQRPAPCFASLLADILNGATNSTVSVFEAGPISVAIERHSEAWLKSIFGVGPTAAMTFTNGGTESALTALLCARERWFARTKTRDLSGAFVIKGEHAHYCIERAAKTIGIPPSNILTVATDTEQRICIQSLRKAILDVNRAQSTVLSVVGSSGCTATGSFDDLVQLRQASDDAEAWLHIDASHGGAARLTETHKHLVDGLCSADSFQFNPHKMMWLSPPCACLMVKDQQDLHHALSNDVERATYIVSPRHIAGAEIEKLELTFACTRQFSALKVFAALYIYGTKGIARRVDQAVTTARDLGKIIKSDSRFELLAEPEFNIVCFRPALRAADCDGVRQLRTDLAGQREAYLTGAEVQGQYWLRAQCTSENTRPEHLHQLLNLVDRKYAAISGQN